MQLKYKFAQYTRRFFFTLCALQRCLHFTGANENATRNEAVVAGSNATLQCRLNSNGNYQWKYKQGNGFEERTLTYNQNISLNGNRLTLNTTIDGQYDLHITNADRSDAGIYICITEGKSASENGSSITQRYEAQLVILTSDPNCSLRSNTLVENGYIQMDCYVRVLGHLFPVMKWRREGQQLLVDGAETNITKAPVGNQITVRSFLLLQVSLMDNGIRFSCDTLFAPHVHNISSDGVLIRAGNAPDYNFTWTSPLLSVSSGPQNVTIHNAFGEETTRLARNSTETGHMCDTNTSEIHCTVASSKLIHSDTESIFVVFVLIGILSALILIVIGRRNNIICRYNKGNGENRSEIENDSSLYSDARDERNAWSSRIATNDCCQNGKREGQVEIGNNNNCNVSQDNLVAIYEEVKAYESDLTVTGDSMHYASFELSTPQCDIRYTKGLNSNRTNQETLKQNQNVGADGTIYTEVKGTENLYSTVQKEPKSTSFKKSDYAAIDHTVKSLPPPPRLSQ